MGNTNVRIYLMGGFVVLLTAIVGLVYLFSSGVIEEQKQVIGELEFKNVELSNEYNKLYASTIEFDYYKNSFSSSQKKLKDIQGVYDSLVFDWQNCYASDLCLYYPQTCLDWVADNFEVTNMTARELHAFYSDECEKSDRDWDKYYSYYTGDE